MGQDKLNTLNDQSKYQLYNSDKIEKGKTQIANHTKNDSKEELKNNSLQKSTKTNNPNLNPIIHTTPTTELNSQLLKSTILDPNNIKDQSETPELKIKLITSNASGLNKNKLYDFIKAYQKRGNQQTIMCIQDINTKANTILKYKNIAYNNKIHIVNNTKDNKIGTGVIIMFKKI